MNPVAERATEPAPAFRPEGLWAALERLDRLLEKATTAADAAYNSGAAPEPYRGLYISSESVTRMLQRQPGSLFLSGSDTETGERMPPASRFPWLGGCFDLTAFDLDVVLIALAPEVDARYERLFAYLQDDVTHRRPSVDLALNLLCATRDAKIQARERFSPGGPLLRHRLLRLVADSPPQQLPLLAHTLKLDDSIVRLLLGSQCLDERLSGFARLERPPQKMEPAAGAELLRAARRARENGRALHVYLEGRSTGPKRAVAESLARSLEIPLLCASLTKAALLPLAEFDAAMGVLFREALLLDAVLSLEEFDALRAEDRRFHLQTFQQMLEDCARVVVIEGVRPMDPTFQTVVSVPVPEPNFRGRYEIWENELRLQAVDVDARSLHELANRFHINADQIRRSIQIAIGQSELNSRKLATDALMRAARTQSRRELGSLARKVTPVAQWQDLVLPPDQIAQLKEICLQARFRHVVYDDWGFEGKLSLGKGLSALFSGPPGTGKTMSGDVIAGDLGLELYKIDLSQVVSKYIGETEKNLDRLFTGARDANAILFFDECDALFGKRITVQDAHDRYANIEISYLLQKMDEHDGLTILTTNLRQNLDAAFLRRLTFIVEFPFPDETSRRRIWGGIWPDGVPRSRDLDLDFMAAQFKVPGGAVKNIAVAAAFLAVNEDKPEVTTEHLLWATRRELEKAGRTVTRAEFGRYADLMLKRIGEGRL